MAIILRRRAIWFYAVGKGCEVLLPHKGVWDDYAARTRDGWTKMLEALDTSLRAVDLRP